MSLADQAGIAIENARLYETLETRADRLRTLARLNQLISSSLDMDAVLHEIARARPRLQVRRSCVSCLPTRLPKPWNHMHRLEAAAFQFSRYLQPGWCRVE